MKPNLLLLHGALSDQHQFDVLRPLLEDAFTVHTFNFGGHGDRKLIHRPLSMVHLAENIREFIEENQLNSFFAFGYSMGGYAAYLFNDTHPGKLKKLFTLATKIKWDDAIAAREIGFLDLEKMKEKVPDFVAFLEKKHSGAGLELLVSEIKNMLGDLGENDYLTEELLQIVDIPVHITVGDKDKTVTIDECQWANGILEKSAIEILQDTPHAFEKVDIQMLSESIKKFFVR